MNDEKNPKDRFGAIPIADDFTPAERPARRPVVPEPEAPEPERPPEPAAEIPGTGRVKMIAITLISLLLLYTLGGFFLTPLLMRTLVPRLASRYLDRPVTVGAAAFNPFTLTMRLRNGIIGPQLAGPPDQPDPLLSFGRLEINFDSTSLLQGAPTGSSLDCEEFFLHIVRTPDGALNLGDLLAGANNGNGPFNLPFRFAMRNISITDGRLLIEDRKNGKTHKVEEIKLALPYWSTLRQSDGAMGRMLAKLTNRLTPESPLLHPRFSATVNSSPVSLTGETKMSGDTLEASLELRLQALNLTEFNEFIPATLPLAFGKGSVDLDLGLIFAMNREAPPTLQIQGDATLHDIWLRDRAGRDLASAPNAKLSGRLAPFAGTYNFTDIVLEQPEFRLERDADGGWSLPAIASPAKRAATEPRPMVTIDRLKIKNGKLAFTDRKVSGGYAINWLDLQGTAESMTSDTTKPGQFALTARSEKNSGLSVQGQLALNPLNATGVLILKDMDLTGLTPYLTERPSLKPQQGRLDSLTTHFRLVGATAGNPAAFSLVDSDLRCTDLVLLQGDRAAVTIPELSLSRAMTDFSAHRLNFGRISINQGRFTLGRDQEGRITPGTARLFAPDSPWRTSLTGLEINQAVIEYTDENQTPPIRLNLQDVTCQAAELDSPAGTGTIKASARLATGGTIELNGPLTLEPFGATLAYELKKILLPGVSPLLAARLVPKIRTGNLEANGTLRLPAWTWTGAAKVDDFSAAQDQQPVIGWQQATFEDFQLSTATLNLTIAGLTLESPRLVWSVPPDGQDPWSQFLHPAPESQDKVEINRLTVHNGSLDYLDPSIHPRFSLALSALDGTVTGFANQPGRQTIFAWHGLLDRATGLAELTEPVTTAKAGTIDLSGSGDLLGRPLECDLRLQAEKIALAPLSPFLADQLGHLVTGGDLELTTSYRRTATTIDGDNHLRIKGLQLGKPVNSASHLPFAAALLTDPDGVISLDIPVRDSSEPTSFTAQLLKGVRGITIRAIAAPFTLLGNLFPGQEIADNLFFAFGRAELSPDNQEQLRGLAKMLTSRPGLQLNLKGCVDTKGDREAMLAIRQVEILAEKKRQERKLAEQLQESYGKEKITPLRDLTPPAGGNSVPPAPPVVINEASLRKLAATRVATIQRFLTEQLGVAPQRILAAPDPVIVGPDTLGRAGNRVNFGLTAMP